MSLIYLQQSIFSRRQSCPSLRGKPPPISHLCSLGAGRGRPSGPPSISVFSFCTVFIAKRVHQRLQRRSKSITERVLFTFQRRVLGFRFTALLFLGLPHPTSVRGAQLTHFLVFFAVNGSSFILWCDFSFPLFNFIADLSFRACW